MEKIGGKKGLLAKKRIICESRKFAWKESTFSASVLLLPLEDFLCSRLLHHFRAEKLQPS